MQVDVSQNSPFVGLGLVRPREREPVEDAPAKCIATPVRDFDGASDADWRELMRDVTAIANSGGGTISLGQSIDASEVYRRLSHIVRPDCVTLKVQQTDHSNGPITTISVGAAKLPIDFGGIVYFRHGDRSEPASSTDVRGSFERLLGRARRRWLRAIRRIMNAPLDSLDGRTGQLEATKRERTNLQPVRIVNDPSAPALQPQDVDRLYPWRQKELVGELNRRLGRRMLNSYDIQAVRRQHRLDDRPEFIFNLPGAGRRYSPAVAEWIMDQYTRDPAFFHRARIADHELMKRHRRKPK